MSLASVSIERPVFATMINLILVVFGLFSLPRLAIEQFPNVDFPVISVWVGYPGADPVSVEQKILSPLEKAVNGISGLERIRSTAFSGAGLVVLQFKLDKPVNEAAQEVRDKVFAKLADLPSDIKTPSVEKFDISGAPIVNLAVVAPAMSVGELSALVEDNIRPKLQRIEGVARVDTSGEREREIHVYANRTKLAAYGLAAKDLVDAIKTYNLDIPSGRVTSETHEYPIRVVQKSKSAFDVSQIPVLNRTGSVLRVGDVSRVVDTVEDERSASFYNEAPTILMAIFKQSGANTTTIADGTRSMVQDLIAQLPKGVQLSIVADNSKYIRGSIDALKLDLVLGAIFAVFVVLIFLQDIRATAISAVTLPVAVIATFGFLKYMGFTLNSMSALGLSLSIGILIDDAIVVIENIYRHLQQNKTPKQAAMDATSEIGLAVFATTLTICAVFVPVAFMEGIIGRFFYQFGLTVAFAVLVSLFVAFTLTPMLSSRLLRADSHLGFASVERVLARIDYIYRELLTWALRNRYKTLAFGVATFVLSFVMLRFVPVAFFPQEDKSVFTINLTLPENTPLTLTKKRGLELSKALRKIPEVKAVILTLASGSQQKQNAVRASVQLLDKHERSKSQDALMAQTRAEIQPNFVKDGSDMVIMPGEGDGGGGGRGGGRIQMIFRGNDLKQLESYTDQVLAYVRNEVPMTADSNSSKSKPQQILHVSSYLGLSADLGVNPAIVGQNMRALFEGDKVGEIESSEGRFDIRVSIGDEHRQGYSDVASMGVSTKKGLMVPAGSVAKVSYDTAPASIERFEGQRQITISSDYIGKDLNGALKQIETYVDKTMPAGISVNREGEGKIMAESIGAMMRALLLAVILIYMILCAQYERYLAPFVIMMALPLSFTGAFGALLITGQAISVYTMIGIILLMGIVTKNGILLIDFTLQRISSGMSVNDALLEAGPIRLRPILMTTFAAGFGMLPIALGHGEGGEAKSPMGVAVIGGLLASTFLTLVIVPCLFSLVEQWRAKKIPL